MKKKKKKKKKKRGTMLYRLLVQALSVLHNTRWGEHKKDNRHGCIMVATLR